MAYYNNPYTYNLGYYPQVMQPLVQPPMVYPQQQMVEPVQSQQQTATQPQQMQPVKTNPMDSYFIWVQGEAGAKSYPVARGTTVPLFDSEGDFVYFKSVDNNGVPLPLVTKVISDPPAKEETPSVVKEAPVEVITPQPDMSNYVTKKNYDELVRKYSELETRLLELETKPASVSTTFTGNTFNNSRKGKDDGNKYSV